MKVSMRPNVGNERIRVRVDKRDSDGDVYIECHSSFLDLAWPNNMVAFDCYASTDSVKKLIRALEWAIAPKRRKK